MRMMSKQHACMHAEPQAQTDRKGMINDPPIDGEMMQMPGTIKIYPRYHTRRKQLPKQHAYMQSNKHRHTEKGSSIAPPSNQAHNTHE